MAAEMVFPLPRPLCLDSILSHFWEKPRVSPPTGGDSFGWWAGKVGGDQRSFAQVVSSPPRQQPSGRGARTDSSRSMGDRGGSNAGGGGRFYGRRGGYGGRNPQGGRVVNNNSNNNIQKSFVWNRDTQEGEGSGRNRDIQNQRQSGGGSHDSEVEQGEIAPRPGYKAGMQKGNHGNSGNKSEPCFNCNVVGHFAASCPTIRCVRCKKLGHIRELCQAILPWECIPSMCGFQAQGLGFFYFPDVSDGKQNKEKPSSVVISVIEGNPTFRDIEVEFNEYFDGAWRCTARAIGPNQFLMRFPNSKEVDKSCRFGKRMDMVTFNGAVSIKPWSAAAGAKAELHKAWVRVKNIPSDKRCDATAAYVGSLVGVSLEIDQATLHKPEYCRILIGCRDINRMPEVAEGVLGDYFYDFYYEIETILVGGAQKEKNAMTVDSRSAPSPKRSRIEHSSSVDPSNNSTELSDNSRSDYRDERGRRTHDTILDPVIEEVSEDTSEEDQGLLIEQLGKEGQDGDKNSEAEISQKLGSDELRDLNTGGDEMVESQETVQSAEEIVNKNQFPDENANVDNNQMQAADVDQMPRSDASQEGNKKPDVESQDGTKVVNKPPSPDRSTWIINWAPVTPVVQQESPVIPVRQDLYEEEWPKLVNITEVEVIGTGSPAKADGYFVQSPESESPGQNGISGNKEAELEIPRNQAKKLGRLWIRLQTYRRREIWKVFTSCRTRRRSVLAPSS